jgi:ABC-type taurine transport system ATPase subunit
MITKITINNFKRLDQVELSLGESVVLVGPNNSGKTSALQALALWSLGVEKWLERRSGGKASQRVGVRINRRDLLNIPLLKTSGLWRELRVRNANQPIPITVEVEGISDSEQWKCPLQFTYVDPDNILCRPTESTIPNFAAEVSVAFLPSISGLVSQEDLLQTGSVDRRIGEGRVAEVLRNLCYRVSEDSKPNWANIVQHIKTLFGAELQTPQFDSATGILTLSYRENGVTYDLNASGQGFRQTLLLLTHLYLNPNALLLLDEPDAHLEILRQQQIYQTLREVTQSQGSQLLIASHSEVLLNEAAQTDQVIAFVGKPHTISKTPQVRAALAEYGFEHYYQAEQTGWVLYLEGATDLRILQTFAKLLGHTKAIQALEKPFAHYVSNQPPNAHRHFFAVREAVPTLSGFALFDRLDRGILENKHPQLIQRMWERREIENYFAFPNVLQSYTGIGRSNDMFEIAEATRRKEVMDKLITRYFPPLALESTTNKWWLNTKLSDDVLDPLFEEYFTQLGLPNEIRKSGYYRLVDHLPPDQILPEVRDLLDLIADFPLAP